MRMNAQNWRPTIYSLTKTSLPSPGGTGFGYGVKAAIFILLMFLLSSSVFYQIFMNYVPFETYAAITKGKDKIFFLRSRQTIDKLASFGIEKDGYLDRLKQLEQMFFSNGYTIEYVEEKALGDLPKESVLFAFDTIALSDDSVRNIEKYVSKGGFLVFNYHFAYNSENSFRDNKVVHKITGLQYPEKYTHISSKESLFLIPRIMSPITSLIDTNAERTELYTVDSFPLLVSERNQKPDLKLANWALSAPPTIKDEGSEVQISEKESGAVWHGKYKHGNWVYFSFPSYSLFSVEESLPLYSKLLAGVVEFSRKPGVVVGYPYVDTKNVVFVSEDAEHRFPYFKNFITAADKYKIPVSAYCVSSLAEEEQNISLIKQASENKLFEIGSHSHSHKKIIGQSESVIHKEIAGSKEKIDALSGLNLTGFRPPREEMNEVISAKLSESGYTYLLEKNKGYLYPRLLTDELYVIPRTATDDYQYLVSLDWSPDSILERMKFETNYITSLDGIYSLSIHTHLLGYKSNINIIENYFEYLNDHKEFTPLNGQQIIDRVITRENISYKLKQTKRNFLISVKNNNGTTVKNLKIRIYWTKEFHIKSMRTEIRSSSVKYTDNQDSRYTDIHISSIRPKSDLLLIAEYDTQ